MLYIRAALHRIGDRRRGYLDLLPRLAHRLTAFSGRPGWKRPVDLPRRRYLKFSRLPSGWSILTTEASLPGVASRWRPASVEPA